MKQALDVLITIVRPRSLRNSLDTCLIKYGLWGKLKETQSIWMEPHFLKLTSSLGMNFTCTLDLSPGSKTPDVGWISKMRVFGFNSVCSFRLRYFGMCFSSWLLGIRRLDNLLWKTDLFHPPLTQPPFTESLPGVRERVDTRATERSKTSTRERGLVSPWMQG